MGTVAAAFDIYQTDALTFQAPNDIWRVSYSTRLCNGTRYKRIEPFVLLVQYPSSETRPSFPAAMNTQNCPLNIKTQRIVCFRNPLTINKFSFIYIFTREERKRKVD